MLWFFVQKRWFDIGVFKSLFHCAWSCLLIFFGMRMCTTGVTGGYGCGITSVCEYLKEDHSFTIIDMDQIMNEQMHGNSGLLQKLIKQFGNNIITADGVINKLHLNELIGDEKTQMVLEKLIYWPVVKVVLWRIFKERVWKGKDMVALTSPNVYETKILEFVCFPIIAVYVDD